MIEWFARNPVAANLLMVGIVVYGLVSMSRNIPLETFPVFEREQVSVTTSYRGATPASVEDGITTRIEEAIYDLEGIEKINSRSSEGVSSVIAEVAQGYDKRDILDDIKLRVDALSTLPNEAEKPIVSLNDFNPAVIYLAITGDTTRKELRKIADNIRDDLLQTKSISLIEMQGIPDYEISIEVSPKTLNNYNLNLADIGRAIRQSSVDLSAGNIKTRDGDILIRTDGQAYTRDDFARLPVINNPEGRSILLSEIAQITDGFEEQPLYTVFNGQPAIILRILRTQEQSAFDVSDTVHQFIDDSKTSMPQGISLYTWDDDSVILRQRLATLIRSGVQGGILVLLLLSLFLRPAIAFWVFLGVPISFMGAFIFMPFVNGSINVISLFAFILVLGIVVDDAIVTGENIFRKMREGHDPLSASIIGTKQIAIPVTFGILTTVVAFLPLATLPGGHRISFLASQIPMVVIPVLLMSLVESKLILPAHLSHIRKREQSQNRDGFSKLQTNISRGLENLIETRFQPFLKRCLNNKTITLSVLISLSVLVIAFAMNGHIKFTFFPRIASEKVSFSLTMPDTTGFATTHAHINHISNVFHDLQNEYRDNETGQSVIENIYTTSGSNGRTIKSSVGRVRAELIPPDKRHIDISSTEIANEARKRIGEIAGSKRLSVRAEIGRGGEPINVQLSGSDVHRMGEALALIREHLKQYRGVYDIQDNYTGGKEELNLTLKPVAHSLGLSLADIATQVRYAIFGFQAQRIQRGRDELRVMVRYPQEYRSSIEDLYRIKINIGNEGQQISLADVVTITPTISPPSLYRANRSSILNVTADINKDTVDLPALMRDLNVFLTTLKSTYPDIDFDYKGEAEEQADSNQGLINGLIFILICIYALLAIPFKSYLQPLVVLSVIPFAIIGALLGHILRGHDLSIMSFCGMLALIGVVINDSLVLVDYINKRRQQGASVYEAITQAGVARFRPVVLTSLTTFFGLMPLLLDKSTHAQFLIPMAISLGFGILFATAITLIIVPINYLLGYQIKHAILRLWHDSPEPNPNLGQEPLGDAPK